MRRTSSAVASKASAWSVQMSTSPRWGWSRSAQDAGRKVVEGGRHQGVRHRLLHAGGHRPSGGMHGPQLAVDLGQGVGHGDDDLARQATGQRGRRRRRGVPRRGHDHEVGSAAASLVARLQAQVEVGPALADLVARLAARSADREPITTSSRPTPAGRPAPGRPVPCPRECLHPCPTHWHGRAGRARRAPANSATTRVTATLPIEVPWGAEQPSHVTRWRVKRAAEGAARRTNAGRPRLRRLRRDAPLAHGHLGPGCHVLPRPSLLLGRPPRRHRHRAAVHRHHRLHRARHAPRGPRPPPHGGPPISCAYLFLPGRGRHHLHVPRRRTAAFAFFYLWLSVHSFYFLPWRRVGAPQVAFIAIDYAVSLAAMSRARLPRSCGARSRC